MDRNDLYKLAWTMPTAHIADEFNVSKLDVREVCQRYEIPMPGQMGIREHKASGKRLAPLPPLQHPERAPAVVPLVRPNGKKWGAFRSFVATERPAKLHPVAAATERALLKLEGTGRQMEVDGAGVFPCGTTPADRERAIRFIDAILSMFERLGFAIRVKPDGLRVECYGAWFRFSLGYRTAVGIDDADEVILKAWSESPQYHVRQVGSFYGRGTKRIEATFNTILLWLLDTAEKVAEAEKDVLPEFRQESLAERRQWEIDYQRARRRKLVEEEREAERERKLAEKSAANRRREELAAEEARLKAEAEAKAQRPRIDPAAKMTTQQTFLWIVQTAVIVSQLNRLRRDDGKAEPPELSFGTGTTFLIMNLATHASYYIPKDMSAAMAALKFLHDILPECQEERNQEGYDYADWTGFFEPPIEDYEGKVARGEIDPTGPLHIYV